MLKMKKMDKIVVLDYGGQYAHLIANRIRRLGVYSEILDGDTKAKDLRKYKGLILSGGPASVKAADSIKCDPQIFDLGIPILGICYGHQLIANILGGDVEPGKVQEYGSARAKILDKTGILEGLGEEETVWMSHFDTVYKVPTGFSVVAKTDNCPIAGFVNNERKIFSIQFHPEVTHTPSGMRILENFVVLSGAKRGWNIDSYIENISKEIVERVGDKKVFLMISGGVDSTVAFLLLAKALGQARVYGLFVDTGFMRLNERKEVEMALKKVGVENLHVYDASKEYFEALIGIYEPEEKRKIIGNLFLDIQEKVSNDLNLNPDKWFFGQGTIYPDTIETGGTKHADKIKTHHNQIDRIKKLDEAGKVLEPLKQLYKDEVRLVGERLGLDEHLVWRHPFPGPGLAVRCLCAREENYPENVSELESRMNKAVSANVKVLPIKSVGVQGDVRSYRHPAIIFGREFRWKELNEMSTKLTNQFTAINRVLLGLRPDNFDNFIVPDVFLTPPRISILQKADKIVMDFIKEVGISRDIWQFPTVLIPVGVDGKESIVLRPVCSEEAMTANFYQMDFKKLNELVKRLSSLHEISGIFYDITNKPPGTIEWE